MKKLIARIENSGEEILLSLDREILNISFGALDRGSVSDITNWGCFSNVGEVEFLDIADKFKSIASENTDLRFRIYYSSRGIRKPLATFLIDDYEYNDEQKKVVLRLKDKLIDYQNQNVDEYYEFVTQPLSQIWSACSSEAYATDEAINEMNKINIDTSYLEKGSLWSNLDKICQASMLRCFCDSYGIPTFSDETPRQEDKIIIRPRNILSIENKIARHKTKVDNISISASEYTKKINEQISAEVPFTWYYINGTKIEGGTNHIVADWASYSTNCATMRLLTYVNGTPGYYGAGAYTTISKPEHLFRLGDAIIKVNVASTTGTSSKVKRTAKTTHPDNTISQIYTPGKADVYDNSDGSISVSLEEYRAIEEYSQDVFGEPSDLVGTFCFEGGSIGVLGDFFTESGQRTFGSTLENAYALATNELIQVASKYDDGSLAGHIVDTVTRKYSNGVECVVMEVTPSEYYDIKGNSIINPIGDKPLFNKYDIVTPYVMRNGIEQPYSLKDDGSPKSFKVVGIEYSYIGLLRQKLHLQEHID